MSEEDLNDPERHYKRLQGVLSVSKRIQNLALRRRFSPPLITKEEKVEEILVKAKEARADRLAQLGPQQNYIIEIASQCFNIPQDDILECIVDSQKNVNIFLQFFEAIGLQVILMQHQIDQAPTLESGRFKMDIRNQKTMMALFSTGHGKPIMGKSLMIYRLQKEKEVAQKNLSEVSIFSKLSD